MCLTGGDALERVIGADGVEVDAGEVERAAAHTAGGEEEAEQPAPVAAVHLQHRSRVHGPPRAGARRGRGFGGGTRLLARGRARCGGDWTCDCDCECGVPGARKLTEGQGQGQGGFGGEHRPHA